HPACKGIPLAERHGYEEIALSGLTYLVNRADVRVVQGGGGLCLEYESPACNSRSVPVGGQELERHVAAEPDVTGAVHDSHPALAQLAQEGVVAANQVGAGVVAVQPCEAVTVRS